MMDNTNSDAANNASPSAYSQPPLPAPVPPRPGRWQRFLAFPITRIVLYLLVFVGILIVLAIAAGVVSFLLSTVLHLLHRPFPTGALAANQMLLLTIGEGLAAVSALAAFWVMVTLADKRPWASAGFSRQGLATGLTGGFALGAAMLTVGALVLRGLGVYHVLSFAPSVLVLTPLLTYLAVGSFEETFFRGYIFQTLEGRWGSGAALITTSILFGLTHLANPVPGASHWMRVAGPLQLCFEAGLPLGAAYLLTRRWWLSIGIHWAWDYCEGPIYGCPDSGTHDPHTLLHATLSGPALLTGGPFGPEAGLVFFAVGTLTGVLLLWMVIGKGQWVPKPSRAK